MINREMFELGAAPNKIRELFQYGLDRKAEIGADKVFDMSIGNPSVPTPEKVTDCLVGLLERDPVVLHGYTPSPGAMSVREYVAKHIKNTWDFDASPENVYLAAGAAACIAISLRAVCEPGDEVIAIAPFFPEYRVWAENADASLVPVLARQDTFQPDIEAIEAAITPKTSAVIINSPNNPVGVVYTRESLQALGDLLTRKEQELGRHIYLISDEPYRMITYGAEVPFVPFFYPRTLVCYSLSKSLSLPGERIGYVYASDRMDNARETSLAISGAGRAMGYICASALFQYMMAACIDIPSDVAAYAKNRDVLMKGMKRLGYEFIEPEGAFYLWVKALEPDAAAFCERAKEHELLIVPSNGFGMEGWVRVSYCVTLETVKGCVKAFAALKKDYDTDPVWVAKAKAVGKRVADVASNAHVPDVMAQALKKLPRRR